MPPVESFLMTPADLSAALLDIVTTVVEQRREAGADVPELSLSVEDVPLERPKNRDHGDWASNVAMRLAKRVGANPRELAEQIAAAAAGIDGVASAEVAGPGFINFRLEAAAAGQLAKTIVEAGDAYGRGHAYDGLRVNLEFVSANPTGPVHMGGARWAAVGDSLARILQAEGADVTREYYFNDHGSQIDRFARSLLAAYLGEPTPEDGYGGAYIGEIAERVVASYAESTPGGDLATLPRDEQQEVFRSIGTQLMFQEIKDRLHSFGVDFDVYFHEDSLHASGAVERAIQRLDEKGHIFEADGAIWLRTTTFGDDRDRVVIRSNGEPAYISGDLGYYLDKRERGFEQNIIMLGADHHGYIGRMMAMVEAFGDTPNVNLQILIGQLVNLVKDGEPVRMSKRAGTIVTLDDLVDAVGVDAARYALVRSSTDSQLDIDLDLLAKRSNENPVYYVQYAHARTRSVAANAEKAGVDRSVFAPELLTHETESALLGGLQEFPRVVAQAAELREPHRVARYIEELAGLYHAWYAVRDGSTRVLPHGDEPVTDLHRTRLWLNDATGQVIRNGLGLLGVSAPDRM
jgi:arginyl-tRNA synthetase